MKTKLFMLMGISFFAISAFAGGGGGLSFEDKVKEVRKAECFAGTSHLNFSDITWRDPEIDLFKSTNLVIEDAGVPTKRFFVWSESVLGTLPKAKTLKLVHVAMVEKGTDFSWYFDIDIDFTTGEGFLAASRWNDQTHKLDKPYMSIQLRDCALAK